MGEDVIKSAFGIEINLLTGLGGTLVIDDDSFLMGRAGERIPVTISCDLDDESPDELESFGAAVRLRLVPLSLEVVLVDWLFVLFKVFSGPFPGAIESADSTVLLVGGTLLVLRAVVFWVSEPLVMVAAVAVVVFVVLMFVAGLFSCLEVLL